VVCKSSSLFFIHRHAVEQKMQNFPEGVLLSPEMPLWDKSRTLEKVSRKLQTISISKVCVELLDLQSADTFFDFCSVLKQVNI